MIFDTHTDVLYDIVQKRLNGETGVVQSYHIPQMLEGSVTGGIWAYYTDVDHTLCENFDTAIAYILSELEESEDVHIVKTQDDWTDHKLNIVLGLEGLAHVRDLSHLETLYDQGFRHAMLTWNEQNHYATGVAGDKNSGLTPLGQDLVLKMKELGMVIDVSHANEKTFYDILAIYDGPIMASHSNVAAICPHRRNLTDDQIKAIAQTDGVIGVTAVPSFTNPDKPDIASLVDHIDYIKNLVGTRHIALGFDFMNYLEDGDKNLNLIDCKDTRYANNIIDELMARKYSSAEIDGITNLNTKRVINQILK